MPEKKNILFLMSDQMQAAVTDPCGDYIMPNLRALMADGVTCTRAYAPNPICSPSRASLMTGVLPHKHGMVDVTHSVPKYRADYNYSYDTFSKVLKDNGYSNSYYGKWHVEREYCLDKFGYDEFIHEKQIPGRSFTPILKTYLKTPGYDDRVVGGIYSEGVDKSEEYFLFSQAIDYIERHKDGPFFTFISTNAPHDPYTVPKEIWDMYENVDLKLPESYDDNMEDKPALYRRIQGVFRALSRDEAKTVRRYYHAYCTLIDTQIGRIVKYLKDNKLYDDTLIVVLADHGDFQGAHGLFTKGVCAFEEGYKVPMVFKLPANKNGGTTMDTPISICDIGPTVLDISGNPAIRNKTDGVSRKKMICCPTAEDNYVIAENQGQRYAYTQRVVWNRRWKYVFNTFDYDELYDLENDPYEMRNLAADPKYKDVLDSMCSKMQQIICDTEDTTMMNATYFMLRFAPQGPKKMVNKGEYALFNKEF